MGGGEGAGRTPKGAGVGLQITHPYVALPASQDWNACAFVRPSMGVLVEP